MPFLSVESLDDPRLTVYRDVKATRHSKWAGRFVVEGKRLVRRLLLSDYHIESVLLCDHQIANFETWLPAETPAFVMSQKLAADLVGYNFHCGAMACARRKPNSNLEDLIARHGEQTTLIVCPDVNDPENIGTLIRLGAAFGATGILLGSSCADPYSRRVMRVSMGNALTFPIVVSRDLKSDLLRLKSEWQVELLATVVENDDPTDATIPPDLDETHSSPGNAARSLAERTIEPLHSVTRPQRLALLFGNEAHGLADEWLELSDRLVTIPMSGTDSLNVAVAAGIFLYHFRPELD